MLQRIPWDPGCKVPLSVLGGDLDNSDRTSLGSRAFAGLGTFCALWGLGL